tara:strand:- start:3063 stop:3965 length:903 start_codon:yes stop_codon:yes gene_type:complete
MAKHVVLDSLARSGTTLISALLRSQERSVSFCPGFNEAISYKNAGSWPHGICRRKGFITDEDEFDFNAFKSNSLEYIIEFKQFYHLDEKGWESIIMESKSPLDLYRKIEDVFSEKGKDLFFYRWNQCFCFTEKWFSRGDEFKWLTVIRNPLDRACSSFQKHDWKFHDSLLSTVAFAEKLNECLLTKDVPIQFIHYEDLIKEPKKIISSIYSSIGEKLNAVNLTKIIGSNGKPFSPQSSTTKFDETGVIREKKDGYVAFEEFNGLSDKQIGRYKKECTDLTYKAFKQKLMRFPFYTRYFKD